MKKSLFLMALFLLCYLPLSSETLTSTPSLSPADPSLNITDPSYKFEPVIEGDVVIHEFTIKNSGGAPLKILKTESG